MNAGRRQKHFRVLDLNLAGMTRQWHIADSPPLVTVDAASSSGSRVDWIATPVSTANVPISLERNAQLFSMLVHPDVIDHLAPPLSQPGWSLPFRSSICVFANPGRYTIAGKSAIPIFRMKPSNSQNINESSQ